MQSFNAIKKGFSRSKDLKKYRSLVDDAISKGKKADAEAAAKKIKEAQEKAARAKREKELYEEGVKSGKKKGAKRARRKMVAGAAVAGTVYYEGRTGKVSKGMKKAIDYAKRKKATNAAQQAVQKKAAEIAKKTKAVVQKRNAKTTKK